MPKKYAESVIKELYHLHSDGIYRYILLMVGDNHQAEDLTHDTFLLAFKKLGTFQGLSSEKTWLYTIARNVTVDYFRKKKPLTRFTQSFNLTIPSAEPLPQQIIQLGEDEAQLYESLRKLSPSYQEVILLRKIKEFSTEETAHILEWSESKVKTTLFRALKALKKQLLKEGYIHETV